MPRSFTDFIYACYAWTALVLVVLPVAIVFLILPGIMRRRRLARRAAKLICWFTFSPIRLSGWAIPDGLACIVVANHSSYLDGIILTAALPARFSFLIKRQMESVPIVGYILRRLGSEFVDREDPQDRHRMARRLVETARRGWTLAVFPEGTFDVEPGLQPFRTGAFTAALRGRLPIVPVVVKGARHKMPGDSKLPKPGSLSVHICDPIDTAGMHSVNDLIAVTRAAMLEKLDEPDLAS